MFIQLSRSQKTAIGQLRADIVYDFNEKDPGHVKVAKNLLKEGGFGKKLNKKQIEAMKAKAEEIAKSNQAVEKEAADLASETKRADAAEAKVSKLEAEIQTAKDGIAKGTEDLAAAVSRADAAEAKAADLGTKLKNATADPKSKSKSADKTSSAAKKA